MKEEIPNIKLRLIALFSDTNRSPYENLEDHERDVFRHRS